MRIVSLFIETFGTEMPSYSHSEDLIEHLADSLIHSRTINRQKPLKFMRVIFKQYKKTYDNAMSMLLNIKRNYK